MARKIHKSLEYEKKEIAHAKYQMGVLSDVLYDLEMTISPEFVEQKVWTYGSGITFKDTDQEEYTLCKNILPRLSQLDKESSKHGIVLSGSFAESKVSGKQVAVRVSFKWDVPDSCELITKTTTEEVGSDYYVNDDGVIMHKRTETIVNCTKPVLESVFRSKEELASG
tara:strand:- start:374 stop:877 length:504 start_codon:yes stop_codon:yes gene_type:complete